MNITRDNYETYFIDYWDDKLTPQQVNELKLFLLINSDLEEYFHDLNITRLSIPSIEYPHKKSLNKEIFHECPDYYAIAIAENALTEEDYQIIKKHNPAPHTIAIYKRLKLKPDLSLSYPGKSQLYHKNKALKLSTYISVAATLLLFIGIGYLYYTNLDTNSQTVADVMQLPLCPEITPLKTDTFAYEQLSKLPIIQNHKSQITPTQATYQRNSLPLMEVLIQPIAQLSSPSENYQLVTEKSALMSTDNSEIYLEANAKVWKTSENTFLSDNIFNSIINTGKMIAGIIKNKEEN